MTPAEQMREAAAKVGSSRSKALQKLASDAVNRADSYSEFQLLSEMSAQCDDLSSEIRALPIPAEATEPTDTARMKAALGMATETLIAVEAALMLIDTLCQDRGRSTKQARCGEVARDALTAIREALGET